MVLCALGARTLLLPWAEATVVLFDPSKPPRADGSREEQMIYSGSQGTAENGQPNGQARGSAGRGLEPGTRTAVRFDAARVPPAQTW
jgi:hypothetical protein